MTARHAAGRRRRRSLLTVTSLLALGLPTAGAPAVAHAGPAGSNLPGGTSLEVAVDAPLDGAVVPPGPVAVTGTAAVGRAAPVANTALVYVLDLSFSTQDGAAPGCAADPNGDGFSGRILDCEIASMQALNDMAAAAGTVGDVGVGVFGTGGAPTDVGPAGGEQRVTGPATDANANGLDDVDDVVTSAYSSGDGTAGVRRFTPKEVGGGATNFGAGIQSALTVASASSKPNKVAVLMSDGLANTGPDVASLLPSGGVTFHTFAIGSGSNCTSDPTGRGSLQEIAHRTGGTCTHVSNPASLPDVVPGVIASRLTGLEMTVDGAPAPIGSTSAPLPAAGPTGISYTATTPPLSPGLHTICVTAHGSDGGGSGSVTDCHRITVDAPPQVDAGEDQVGTEGSAVGLAGSVVDGDSPGVTSTWTWAPVSGTDPGATCSFADPGAASTTMTCTDDGVYRATLTGDDGVNPAVTDDVRVVLANAAPSLAVTSPTTGALYPVGTPVGLSTVLGDAGSNDTHTCTVSWDDGTTSSFASAGSCDSSRTFTAAGVYTIVATATDDDGGTGSDSVMVVVYDPSAGFVTGGGTLDSPAGAYTADPTMTGRANFGFVSKYKRGATTPTGQTEFQFKAGDLNFHSTVYDWLVVSGSKAQYKGTGTVNGAGTYGFLLTATDGQLPGGGGVDKLRMKIWDKSNGDAVVYDNALGSSDDLDAADPQAIRSGSIVIHK